MYIYNILTRCNCGQIVRYVPINGVDGVEGGSPRRGYAWLGQVGVDLQTRFLPKFEIY